MGGVGSVGGWGDGEKEAFYILSLTPTFPHSHIPTLPHSHTPTPPIPTPQFNNAYY